MAWDYRSSKDFKDYYEERRLQRRIGFIFVLLAGLFLSYLFNLWYLQVVNGENYRRLADNNRLRQVVENPLRGVILDRQGRPIVRNRIAFNVLLDREKITRLDETVRTLSQILKLPEATVKERIARYRNRPTFEPVIVKEDVDLAEAAYLESRRLELPEVSVAIEPKRSYEDGDLAAHALGYVGEISESQLGKPHYAGYQLGDVVGKAGLESFYDADLTGEKGWKQVIVNSLGREIRELPVGKRPVPGNALHLTLDLDLQEELERAFEDKTGSAVFLDPDTGEVLAIVSKPSFDPNVFARRFSAEDWRALINSEAHPLQDRAIQSKFAPGSVFKIVLAIAALESGKASPSRTDFCPGYTVIYGRKFLCHQEGGHGTIAMVEAIKKSCNVYFYHLGKDLGIELISQWAHRLGFGQRTGVDLMHEEAGRDHLGRHRTGSAGGDSHADGGFCLAHRERRHLLPASPSEKPRDPRRSGGRYSAAGGRGSSGPEARHAPGGKAGYVGGGEPGRYRDQGCHPRAGRLRQDRHRAGGQGFRGGQERETRRVHPRQCLVHRVRAARASPHRLRSIRGARGSWR
ncbi:MAG: penicillin-binding protein 2 [Acidobacteria bacterium]|nr:MAG: penicillin-binding protein 2 [Acidobacteriota bacterium]